jgi:hypothetical protein
MISRGVWHFQCAISHRHEKLNEPRHTTRLSVRERPTLGRSVAAARVISASRFLGFPATYEVVFHIHMVIDVICPISYSQR